jgi:hypothetical protein
MMEEKDQLRSNQNLVARVNKMLEKYGEGKENVTVNLRFVDYTDNAVVINMLIALDEKDILTIGSASPDEVYDITADVDFGKVYNFIEVMQKDNKESLVMYPGWDNSAHVKDFFNNAVNIVKMWRDLRGIIGSIQVTPKSAKADVLEFGSSFFWDAMRQGQDEAKQQQLELAINNQSSENKENKEIK